MVAIKGWTWSETMLRQAVAFKRCPIGTKGPKVCQENIPHTITPPPPACTVVTKHDGSMFSFCLRQIQTHLNVSTEIEIHQTRQQISSLQLSNFENIETFLIINVENMQFFSGFVEVKNNQTAFICNRNLICLHSHFQNLTDPNL